MPDTRNNFRFESGPIIKIFAGLTIAGFVGLAIFAFATGNAFAVGLVITLLVAGATGLILERLDSSRSREQGSEGTTDEHWGFRGRPGS